MFQYKRIMQFYETDAMGIIHHANYVLLMEEARLCFVNMVNKGAEDPLADINYPLVSCHVDYKKPLYFNDEVTIEYSVEIQAARLVFNYTMSTKRFEKPVAFGKTVHAAYDMKAQKATRVPKEIIDFVNKEGNDG